MPAKNLLRPNQVEETKRELSQLDGMLNSAPHERRHITDIGGMKRRRDRIADQLEAETPRPYAPNERDQAVTRFKKLAENIKEGMPSSEVMRRNPPGAVQRNLWWHKKNKETIPEYKNMALRLLAGGDEVLDPSVGDAAVNIEMLRPHTTSHDMAMDGAQIPKEQEMHLNEVNSVTFSEEQVETLTEIDPELASQLALLSGDQRFAVKEMLSRVLGVVEEEKEVEVSSTDINPLPTSANMKINELRSIASSNGIKSFQRTKDNLREELISKGLVRE